MLAGRDAALQPYVGWGQGTGQGMNEILCINPIKHELPQKRLPSSHLFLLLMQKGAGMHVTNSTEFK